MTITIKYSLEAEDTGKAYNTFEEIQQLKDYNDIVYIRCSHNKLTVLPPTLPDSLQKLYCSDNKLTELPPTLPDSLQELYCDYNKLTELPQTLPDSLQILDCDYNKLTELPPNLPQSLQKLYCSNNKLTELPPTLPDSLQILYCYSNKLTELPPTLPDSLQELYCYYNNLIELPSTLPDSLQKLDCYDNKLTELPPTLPNSLQKLYCSHNNLIELPQTLPDSLQILYCSHNNLIELPQTLPDSLQKLYCSDNNLTELPTNLHEYRNLTSVDYYGNEIEYIPPHIIRFLNHMYRSGNDVKIYDDGQNVHNHQIQESIRNSIYAVMKTKPSITTDEMCSELVSSVVLSDKTKRLLIEYCEDDSVHGVIGITFKELLLSVWSIIRDHKDSDEILAIMNTEMDDADCKCFTGKMSRLINCLNGYDDRVAITMAENDQIGNIIIIEKEKLEIEGRYTTESHKDNVRLAMEERKYPLDIIEEWSSYIE